MSLKHLTYISIIPILIVMMFFPEVINADGQYRILLEEDGLFFETENDGGWYIPEEDQQFFKPGQKGYYTIRRDSNGSFLKTEHGKFYLGHHSEEELDTDIDAFNRSQNKSMASTKETKVIVVGQHVLVPVRIMHRGRSQNLKLLLDTGASMIILHKDAVNRLQLNSNRKVHFTTASGDTLPADMVELNEFRFGPYRKYNILAGVIKYRKGVSVNYDGLLGMNALRGLDYKIDYQNNTIQWMNAM